MEFSWIESIIYGFVSGFAEFLPVSSEAHQQLMLRLFGVNFVDPVRNLFIHIATFVAIYINSRSFLEHTRRERALPRRSKNYKSNSRLHFDYRFLKNAMIPMLVVFFVLRSIAKPDNNLLLCSVITLLNGVCLFLADRMVQGNKDARIMSSIDSLFVGVAAGLSALPGFSRIGCAAVAASARGAERRYCINWALLLCIPALIATIVLDIVHIFGGAGYPFWINLFSYIISALTTYIGSYFSIRVLRYISIKSGFSTFAYYSLGLSILLFVLYLIVV